MKRYESYKDSGVEWLGKIPEDWKAERLGTILYPISVKNRPNEKLLSITKEQGVIVRNLEDEAENHNYIPDDLSNYKLLKTGQFGMNKMKAWQGSYGISKHTGIVSPAYYVFKLKTGIYPRFFHLAIRSRLYISYFGQASDGVRIGQWDLSKTRMSNILVALPPVKEQTAIAQFLDQKTAKIDQAITKKERLIELLKERKQALIQQAVTKGLDPTVKMKDSGIDWIGEIPEHWEVKKLSYISQIDTGATPDRSKANYWDGTIPWVKTGEVNYEEINITEELITEVGLRNSATRLAPKGTLLMAMYGQGVTRGRVSLLGIEASYNQACCAIQFNQSLCNKYGYYFFKMAYSFIRDDGNETSQMNISSGYISTLKMTSPSLPEQKSIVKYVKQMESKINQSIDLHETQIEKLKEYKASLVDAAVTGKIKVC